MVSKADWLKVTRDLGQVPPTIDDDILFELAVDVTKEMTREYDIWFLKKTAQDVVVADTREVWPPGLSRPIKVYRFTGSTERIELKRVRDEVFDGDYPNLTASTGPPTDYRLFGPNIQIGPTPTEDTTIYVDGFFYDGDDLPLWLEYADDFLKYAALAGSEAAGFNDERIPLWASIAQRKGNTIITEGSRQGYLVTPRTMRGDWRVTGGNRGG